jgi:hypothetical protein
MLNIALATTAHSDHYALFREFHRGVVSNMMAGVEEVVGTHGSFRLMVVLMLFMNRFLYLI